MLREKKKSYGQSNPTRRKAQKTKYKKVAKLEIVEYLKDASEMINAKNVIIKIVFLFLSYLRLFLGTIIKKQLKIAINGI